ncbi:hypothetical protein QQP08_000294, partial [Theobroma cacao]
KQTWREEQSLFSPSRYPKDREVESSKKVRNFLDVSVLQHDIIRFPSPMFPLQIKDGEGLTDPFHESLRALHHMVTANTNCSYNTNFWQSSASHKQSLGSLLVQQKKQLGRKAYPYPKLSIQSQTREWGTMTTAIREAVKSLELHSIHNNISIHGSVRSMNQDLGKWKTSRGQSAKVVLSMSRYLKWACKSCLRAWVFLVLDNTCCLGLLLCLQIEIMDQVSSPKQGNNYCLGAKKSVIFFIILCLIDSIY